MAGAAQISIVVPCYNEAERLPVERFRAFVASHAQVRFVFVNDGSTDGTSALLQSVTRSDPSRFEQLDRESNRGKAEAVRVGMLHALAGGARYVGYWDADLATPLSEIPRFVEVLESHPSYDSCFGARVRLLGRVIERNPYRHYFGRLFATAASYVLDLAVYDTQCGAKLFRASPEIAAVFAQPFCVNWTFDVEIVARLQSLRRRAGQGPDSTGIYELPLDEWHDVAGSKVHASDFFIAMLEMLRIQAKYGRGGSKGNVTAPDSTTSAL